MICCRMLSTSAVSILMPFKSSWGSRAVSSTTTLLRMSRRFSCTDLMGKQSHYWSHEGSTFTFKKLLVFHLFNFSEINLTTKMYHKEGFFLCTTSRACLYRTLTCCHWPRCYSPSSCSDLLSSPSWTCSAQADLLNHTQLSDSGPAAPEALQPEPGQWWMWSTDEQ